MTRKLPVPDEAIAKARLPHVYQAARAELARCVEIDECQAWADKAEALASYARQAGDDSLRRAADRIQARAIRRCGELLREIAPAPGRPSAEEKSGRAPSRNSRTAAARAAGLSEHQRKTAVRVASLPEMEFEQAVESTDPPTVTELAERGRVREETSRAAAAPVLPRRRICVTITCPNCGIEIELSEGEEDG